VQIARRSRSRAGKRDNPALISRKFAREKFVKIKRAHISGDH
jgi:hypothetical protein